MKSYTLTGANQRVYLFSTDENIFGVKSTDASGMPLPLEMFRYERIFADKQPETRSDAAFDASAYVTRDEFEARIAAICAKYAQVEKDGVNDGK